MLNKDELFAMTSDQVYEAILNGTISAAQFEDWREDMVYRNREEAYNNGYDSGYESAQYAYEYR